MIAAHFVNEAPDYQRQNYRADKNKPFDHFQLLPAVLAMRKLVAALLGLALVNGDAVRGRLSFALALAAALVLAEICDNLLLAPAYCCS
jgi:hypothetical protein